jgi:hypothetical protein
MIQTGSTITKLISVSVVVVLNPAAVGGYLYDKYQNNYIAYPSKIALTSFVVPSGVLAVKNGAFSGSRLMSVALPDSFVHLGFAAFDRCIEPTEFDILNAVVNISDGSIH